MNSKLKVILSLLLFIGVVSSSIYGFEAYKKHKIVTDAQNEISLLNAEIQRLESLVEENTEEIKEIEKKDIGIILKTYGTDETAVYRNSNKSLNNDIKNKRQKIIEYQKIINEN